MKFFRCTPRCGKYCGGAVSERWGALPAGQILFADWIWPQLLFGAAGAGRGDFAFSSTEEA
jgi:hypothetical protein